MRDYHNLVRMLHRTQPMSNDQRCMTLHNAVQRILHNRLSFTAHTRVLRLIGRGTGAEILRGMVQRLLRNRLSFTAQGGA